MKKKKKRVLKNVNAILSPLKVHCSFEGKSFPNVFTPAPSLGEDLNHLGQLGANLCPYLKPLWARQLPPTGHRNSDGSSQAITSDS